MNKTLSVLALLIGSGMLIPSTNLAVAETFLVQRADPLDESKTKIRIIEDANGNEVERIVLARSNESYTNEKGALSYNPNTKKGVVSWMHTDSQVTVQGGCRPFDLVDGKPVLGEMKIISERNGDDNRNWNHPSVEWVGPGPQDNYFMIAQNYQQKNNGNTERNVVVVDENCVRQNLTGNDGNNNNENIELIEDNTAAIVMAKNNDNCASTQTLSAGEVTIYNGIATVTEGQGCNGNGGDNTWNNTFTVQCALPDSTCDIQKIANTVVGYEEERGHPFSAQLDTTGDGVANLVVTCHNQGDNQPQREGVWCTGVDMETNEVVWNDQLGLTEKVGVVDENGKEIKFYMRRISMFHVKETPAVLMSAAVNPSNRIVVYYKAHVGRNNGNRKGGYENNKYAQICRVNDTGSNCGERINIKQIMEDEGCSGTHPNLFQTFSGENGDVPAMSLLCSNFNGNRTPATVLNFQILENDTLLYIGKTVLDSHFDNQKWSKYMGNNPNNQGKNAADCTMVPHDNPDICPTVNICALSGKYDNDDPSLKLDVYLEVWNSCTQPTVSEPIDSQKASSSCSTGTGLGSGVALVLIGFFAFGLRRRQHSNN